MSGLAVAPKTHSFAERQDDFYPTPIEAVRSLMALERLPRAIWEPACGDGAIVKPLREAGHDVVASDIHDRGCPDSFVRDFLALDVLGFALPVVDGIVTNPPFQRAREFVDKALEHAPYVAMLLRLQFLEGAARKAWFASTPLARVWVSSRRLPMMHRDGWDGPKSTSTQCYGWFCWGRHHQGPPAIKWFDWREFS